MSKIIGRECKFIFHLPEIEGIREDVHIIKETLHYADEHTEDNLKILKNYKRPFWVTKEYAKKHKQKKESEYLTNVNKFYSTQSRLAQNAAARLGGKYIGVTNMRKVADSPYLYGCDVDSKAHIKYTYMKKYPNLVSPFRLAVLDIENDIETKVISCITLSMQDKSFTVINKSMVKNVLDPLSEIKYLSDKYVPKIELLKACKDEYIIVDKESDIIVEILKKAHEWHPDFVAVWNIDYDIPHMVERLDVAGINPKDVFSDPTLPKEYRHFKYNEGSKKKVTESGVVKIVSPEEQWHWVDCPASFWWIDAMSAHKFIRQGSKNIPTGYSLDSILDVEFKGKYRKLKFEKLTDFSPGSIEWHNYVSKEKPIHYIVYNNWDCKSILGLDDKTKDLSHVLPMLAGVSSFAIFNSTPKRIIDALHFFYLENGRVLGTKPSRVDDDKLLTLKNWIIMLPSHRIKENGMNILTASGVVRTNMRGHTFDADYRVA